MCVQRSGGHSYGYFYMTKRVCVIFSDSTALYVEQGLIASSHLDMSCWDLEEQSDLPDVTQLIHDTPELLTLCSCPITELFSMPLFQSLLPTCKDARRCPALGGPSDFVKAEEPA